MFDRKSALLLDLDFGALDLSFWSWAFDPASLLIRSHYHFWTWCWSIGLVLLKLGLRPSSIFNKKSLLFLDLDVGALDLSFWSWAFSPASFLIRNRYCFWTWMLEHWTCPFEAGPIFNEKSCLFLDLDVGALDLSFWSWAISPASSLIRNLNGFWTWMVEHWTCPFEAGSLAQLQF